MNKDTEIEGEYLDTKWRSEDSDFGIHDLVDGTCIVGDAPNDSLVRQCMYRFHGEWVDHPRFGRQFKFDWFRQLKPHSRDAVVAYLVKKSAGVGTVTAGRIYDAFGADSIASVKADPKGVAARVKGFTPAIADLAAAALREDAGNEDAKIDLYDLLKGRGFPKVLQGMLIKKWKGAAADIVRRDPFRLMLERFRGCSFLRCDQLYRDLGSDLLSTRRQGFALWYVLDSDMSGSTWLSRTAAADGVRSLLDGVTVDFEAIVEYADIELRVIAKRDGHLAHADKAMSEQTVAECVTPMLSENGDWPDVGKIEGVSDHQRDALRKAFTQRLCVLNGGAGTGKTWTTAAALRAIIDKHGPQAVAVCAPTGKAAVRITSAMLEHGVPIIATTIHRLLEVRPSKTGGFQFQRDEHNPISRKYVVVDETSMVDASLASHLFSAIGPDTNVMLVGDTGQLPPVSHGAPFRDLIAAGTPTGTLTEIHRNSGDIVKACTDIRNGRRWRPSNTINPDAGHNLLHIPAQEPEDVVMQLIGLIQSLPAKYDKLRDVQVIVAVNHKSPLCREKLNGILQSEFNPAGLAPDPLEFKLGDKVICTKNGIQIRNNDNGDAIDVHGAAIGKKNAKAERPKTFVANGEIGIVVDAKKIGMVVRLDEPDRHIYVPLTRSSEFVLAYAITVHRSQGSQWPIVIYVSDDYRGARYVTSREFVYTSLSRAQRQMVTIGNMRTMLSDCRRTVLPNRKTFLREMISELVVAESGYTIDL